MYQIKEKKEVSGKSITTIEIAPSGAKKLSYFKIDVSIDDASQQIIESKIYGKNGTRYIYKLIKQTPNISTGADTFTFDAKKFLNVKVVDLR